MVRTTGRSGPESLVRPEPGTVPNSRARARRGRGHSSDVSFACDRARVFSPARSNASFPESGVSKDWHNASHHGNLPQAILDFNTINTWRLSQVVHLLERLQNTMEAGSSLLDKSVVVWGSAMGDPNVHNHRKCPLVLMGHANGALEGNMHLRAPEGTPMANVFVSLMQRIGHEDMVRFGDSTGVFPLSLPRSGGGL